MVKYDKIQEYLFESFQLYEDKECIHYLGKTYTYHNLKEHSDKAAASLQKAGVKKGCFVGVFVENRYQMIVSMIGIWKIGAVFVPFDQEYPLKRLLGMAESCEIRYMVVDDNAIANELLAACPCANGIAFKDMEVFKGDFEAAVILPEDAAYLYFTSGTTGQPKPIMGVNKSLCHFIDWEINEFGLNQEIHVSQLTPPCHDPFLRDVLIPLCVGGLLCIPDNREAVLFGEKLTKWINKEEINLIHCTPSLFSIMQTVELDESMFANLKYILLAGEKVMPNMLKGWYDAFADRISLVNLYGPTETTLAKFFYRISSDDVKKNAIPIGMPIKGAKAIVLNEKQKPCGKGAIGEIYIRTPYRTKGYYGDEELTKQKFILNPFSGQENDILFRTGDLARILPDGNFVYEGRMDRQVKIRGFRVELSAVENLLLTFKGIKKAAVVFQNDDKGNLLKAFVVTESGTVDEKEVNRYLSKELPDYMIPNRIFAMDSLPMTSNHKLDYKALLEYGDAEDQNECELPGTETEEIVHGIYCKLLGREQISVEQSFFRLGGNSLNSMALIGEIQREFELELPLGMIFENGSIRGIAEFIDSNKAPSAGRIEPIGKANAYLVTKAQKRMYVINQMIGDNIIYNLPNIIKVKGDFDFAVFKKALEDLISRHEILRTTFFVEDNQILQCVHDAQAMNIPFEELDGRDIDAIIDDFIKPFDLDYGPLIRAKVVKESQKCYYLMFDMHHIIADGTSLGIFTRELMQLCAGKVLETMSIQYKDFAKWQEDNSNKESMKKLEQYWTSSFKGEIPVLDFPCDYPRPLIKTYNGAKLAAHLDEEVINNVKHVAKELNVSEFSVYYAAYLILLHKYTGQNDFIVGTPVQGRNHYQVADMIGMFVNTLPLRNQIDPQEDVKFFIRDIQEELTETFEYAQYQLDDLIEKLDLVRDTSRNPLFDMVFAYHNYDVSGILMDGIEYETYDIKKVSAKFDMEFALIDRNQQVAMQIEYCTDIFKQETIEQFLRYYQLVLSQIASVSVSIKDVKLLMEEKIVFSEKQYDQIGYPDHVCLHEIFEDVVRRYPNRTALTMDGKSMSYEELNRKANQAAKRLVEAGVGANDYVPLFAYRSFEMIVGIMAIIKAGGAYVPINPDYPKERISYMLEQVDAKVILKSEAGMEIPSDVSVLDLTDAAAYIGDGENLVHSNTQNDLLYVIFTSGTTGTPKGVMLEHKNVVRLLFHDDNLYDFNEQDVWIMFHEFCFDFSVWELFGALLNGGRLVLLTREATRDTYAVKELVKKEKVTVLNQVPSAFYNYIKVDDMSESALRYLIFGGEKLIPTKIKEWCKKHKNVRVINMYGITETTVHVTYKELSSKDLESQTSNIGKAIPTLKVYILKGDELCGIGIPGELCVAGLGLGRGYINNEALTKEKFVDNPVNSGERLYRSGDLAKWLPNGDIEYLGRIDEQVQLRGFRIEMGEIESKLREFDKVKDAVAAVKEHENESYLIAYYVAEEDISGQELRSYLLERIPEYMVPQFYVRIEKILITVNGKIDKRALPDPKDMLLNVQEISLAETDMERELADVWSRVLGIAVDNVNDNFFLLGGDSIKALQVVSELKKDNYTTKVDLIFHYQTIHELAPHVEVLTKQAEQGIVSGEMDLLPIQSWFLNRDSENKEQWNQSVLLQTEENIEEDCLEGAFQRVVLHHDALRTIFKAEDGEQAYIRGLEGELFELTVEDEKNCCDEKNVLEKANEVHRSFELEEGPLVKAVLFKGEIEQKLFICVHHLVVDSISWRILIEDLLHSYHAILEDEEESLPLKTDSIKLWSESLEQYWKRERIEDEVEYWTKLSKENTAKLICKKLETKDLYADSAKLAISLNAEETNQLLTDANVAYQTEIQDLLLSALGITLAEWNGEGEKFFVNMEGHGRENIIENIDITRTIGWFTSFYPVMLRSDFADYSMLIRFTKEMLRHIPNKGIGYGILNGLAKSPYRGKFTIEPEVGFSYFGEMNQIALDSDFHMLDMRYGELIGKDVTRPFKLDIIAFVEHGCLTFEVDYNILQYEKEHLEHLLELLKENILELNAHCLGKDHIEYTPDDFGSSDLSFDELACILEAGDTLE